MEALDVIAPHARYKVWIKENGLLPFLYGGNVVKAHVGRWSEDIPEHSGVVVFDSSDTPVVRTLSVEWNMDRADKDRALGWLLNPRLNCVGWNPLLLL